MIVNAASIGGLVGYPMGGAYGPSKAGIVQLTRVMAIELAPQGTRVVCYAPGNTETPMVEKYYSDPSLSAEEVRMVQQQLLGTHLIPRLARPEEVADLVVFLASDEAAMITGTCVVIDGGTTAWRGIQTGRRPLEARAGSQPCYQRQAAGIAGWSGAGYFLWIGCTTSSPKRWICSCAASIEGPVGMRKRIVK